MEQMEQKVLTTESVDFYYGYVDENSLHNIIEVVLPNVNRPYWTIITKDSDDKERVIVTNSCVKIVYAKKSESGYASNFGIAPGLDGIVKSSEEQRE
jgi:hypothetical protein